MPAEDDILERLPQRPDQWVAYGSDVNQFIDVWIPKSRGPHPVLLNIHGGFWRAKYDLEHAGLMCDALRAAGVAVFNIEYRRVGNPGGGWPGTLDDVVAAYKFVLERPARFSLDPNRLAVMGHSAGGQLALCLAAHETSVKNVISLAGVIDLKEAFNLHLSQDAVVEFLGETPSVVPQRYREADPMELRIGEARQWILHGQSDSTVPVGFARRYCEVKSKGQERIECVEIPEAGHFDLIDPKSEAFQKFVVPAVAKALS